MLNYRQHGWDDAIDTFFLCWFSRLVTFAINIATFTFAIGTMEREIDNYFNDVFYRKQKSLSALEGNFFYEINCKNQIKHTISTMLPLRDQDLAKHMRNLSPPASALGVLGPILPRKMIVESCCAESVAFMGAFTTTRGMISIASAICKVFNSLTKLPTSPKCSIISKYDDD